MPKPSLSESAEAFLSLKGETTRWTYRSGLRKFLDFYRGKHGEDVTINHFINLCHDELRKPLREQTRIMEREINDFIDWMKQKGLSNKSIRTYLASVQNLLQYYHITLSYKFVKLPPATAMPKNRKHEWKLNEFKEFFGKATNYRDKAIILCLFQSGMGISELCSLNYGDVREELDEGVLPLCLRLVRKKTGVEYKTFFGRDAVHYLKLYLETRSGLEDDTPLFTKLGSEKRLTGGLVQARFRKLAEKCSFIENDKEGFNPARPHSLRAAFRSRLTGRMDGDLIEFLMGHAIGDVKRAYMLMPTDELRELYASHEHLLSIEKTSKDEASKVSEIGRMKEDYERDMKLQRETISDLRIEVQSLKKRVNLFEDHFQKIKDKLDLLMEESVEDTQKYFQHLREKRLIREDREVQEDEERFQSEFMRTHNKPLTEEELARAKRCFKGKKLKS